MSVPIYNPLQGCRGDGALSNIELDSVHASKSHHHPAPALREGGGGAHSHAPGGGELVDHGHGAHGHGEEGPGPTKVPDWVYAMTERVFKIKKRGTTIELEIYTGIVQFISCLYVLPVVPYQMKRVGYDETASIIATCVTCAIGSIIAAFLTDMPFIIAPPTSVSIFLAVSMQQGNLAPPIGNFAVMISGVCLTIVGLVPPISRFVTKLIPDCIQASTSVGIGLITALAGATEIGLVVRGRYTIVDMGEITSEVVIAISALIIVAACLHYHVKGAFCLGLIFGTVVWWMVEPHDAPKKVVFMPEGETGTYDNKSDVALLVFNLLFLYILVLNGLSRAMSDLAGLTKKSGAIPRAGESIVSCRVVSVCPSV